jgi:hypothetical protein
VVQGSSNEEVAAAAALTVQLALSQQPMLREQLWLRLPVLLQRVFLPGNNNFTKFNFKLIILAVIAEKLTEAKRTAIISFFLLTGSHGLALLLQLAAQGLPDDPEVCSGVLSLVCTQLPDILARTSLHSDPWDRLIITTGLQVTRILLPAANTSGINTYIYSNSIIVLVI